MPIAKGVHSTQRRPASELLTSTAIEPLATIGTGAAFSTTSVTGAEPMPTAHSCFRLWPRSNTGGAGSRSRRSPGAGNRQLMRSIG